MSGNENNNIHQKSGNNGMRKRQLPITTFLRSTFGYNRNTHPQYPIASTLPTQTFGGIPSTSSPTVARRYGTSGVALRRFSSNIFIDPYFHENNRIKTFRSWPLNFICKHQLAMLGFIYTEIGDVVKCVFCHVLIGEFNFLNYILLQVQSILFK